MFAAMNRVLYLLGLIVGFVSCEAPNYDPTTPDGTHNLFVRSFAQKDYKTLYSLLNKETKESFRVYLSNTRQVVSMIRATYPDALQEKAIADLSIPFPSDTFAYREIEMAPTEEEIFMKLCDKMLSSRNETPSLMQKFGTRVQSVVMERPDKALIKTIADETLVYVREPDGYWRTAEVFGINFSALVMVSRQNLDITRTNAEILSK